MKTIGMIGGMSWESTTSYYSALNHGIQAALGGFHSAKIAMVSVDFAEIETLQHQDRWDDTAEILLQAAQSVEAAGADFFMICTNTMHKVADQVEAAVSIPLLHIADATAEKLVEDGVTQVGLLGTRFTMEQDFYKSRLTNKYGIEVVIPDDQQMDTVHNIIYQELCRGEINTSSRKDYEAIIDSLVVQGAQAVILGCTEIALLIQQEHTKIPLYDTTAIHAAKAVKAALD